MNYIRFTIAKSLLQEKKDNALKAIKKCNGLQKVERDKIYDQCHKEVKAIDEELFLLNNW